MDKSEFSRRLSEFTNAINGDYTSENGQWTIKGFIDLYQNVYTISTDTKIVSKILEIHLFPALLRFAEENGFAIVPATHQNYYPDMSFVLKADESIKYAVDFKTTYRIPGKPWLCNGFTLGSHGKYFIERTSTKNIQFPYGSYSGHFCLGIIYDRNIDSGIEDTEVRSIDDLQSITSVISNLQFFVAEKWKIASDKSGSGNTANIGSITMIEDILAGKGMFSTLGEEWFDRYWMNYKKITIKIGSVKTKAISSLKEYLLYCKEDVSKIVKKRTKQP